MGRIAIASAAFTALLLWGCAGAATGAAARAGTAKETAAGTAPGTVAGTAVGPGAESPQIFKNEWCFCILPTLVPERPASRSNVAYGLAVAADGRVFLAGTEPRGDETIGSGWTVRAIAADGAVAWSRSYTSRRSYYDVARALAACPKNRLVAAGYSEFSKNSVTPAHWLVEAYSADGKTLWTDEIAENGMARAEAVACDPAGRVTVAGWMNRGPANRETAWLVRSYSPEGRVAWTRTFWGGLGGKDRATAVACASNGDVLVAGKEDEGGGRSVWRLIRLTSGGKLSWSRSYYGPSPWQDEPASVVVAEDGRIALSGKVSAGDPERLNWRVMVLDPSGKPLWTRDRNGAKGMDDKAMAAIFDKRGRLVVAGYEDGDASQAPPYDAGEWMVCLYGRDGQEIRKFGAAELGTKPGSAFALALRDSEVLVAGFEQMDDVGKTRWFSRKLDSLE